MVRPVSGKIKTDGGDLPVGQPLEARPAQPQPRTVVAEDSVAAPAPNAKLLGTSPATMLPSTRPAAPIPELVAKNFGSIPAYRFASQYQVDEVFADPARAAELTQEYLQGEAKFFAAARNPVTGLSYDGVNLDPRTGQVNEVRSFSAASKECLDIAICIKALTGDPKAAIMVGNGNPTRARSVAADILGKKLASYQEFLAEYPQFGGLLPWFKHAAPLTPMSFGDTPPAVPGLDLGEWLWSMLTAEKALRDNGFADLAKQYHDYNEQVRAKVASVFFDAKDQRVYGWFKPNEPDASADSLGHVEGEHAVHESVMLLWYITLFCDSIPETLRRQIWRDTQAKRVETDYGTTWQGFWGSPHEEWPALIAPMRDEPTYRELFTEREMIRTQNAAHRGYPGLAASANAPGDDPYGAYFSEAGIEGVGSQKVVHNDVFAFYGAFPMLLEFSSLGPAQAGNYGLAWLVNMLHAPRAQTPVGAGESGFNDGTKAARIKTIDGSFTNDLAMMGGLEKETAAMLKEKGKYCEFLDLVRQQYAGILAQGPLNKPVGFALPQTTVPQGKLPEYGDTPGNAAPDDQRQLFLSVNDNYFCRFRFPGLCPSAATARWS